MLVARIAPPILRSEKMTQEPYGLPSAPAGSGPLIWLRLAASEPADGSGPAALLVQTLKASEPGLRCLVTHPEPDGVAPDPGAGLAPAMCETLRPAVVVLLGDRLPEELLLAVARARLPAVMVNARLDRLRAPPLWYRNRRRAALNALSRVLVADRPAADAAQRAGVAAGRIETTGALAPLYPPPSCAEAERHVMATVLAGRQLWFAACVPGTEEEAILAAHEAALAHSHRALLLITPSDPARAPALTARAGAAGFNVAMRSRTDDVPADLQMLVGDEPGEAGLWYRLAPVTYVGGTLSGDNACAPHPFAPATLGSAILRGPHLPHAHRAEWAALDAGRATRPLRDAAELVTGIEELLSSDRAAELAARAWSISTTSAAIAQRIAEAITAFLPTR